MLEKKEKQKESKEDLKMTIVERISSVIELFKRDEEIKLLRKNSTRRATLEFNETFHNGFLAYKTGDWQTAIEKFNQCR